MSKNVDFITDLAIICDLIEKLNFVQEKTKLVFELKQSEFERVFDFVQKKYGRRISKPENSFIITIGFVDVEFNTSSV